MGERVKGSFGIVNSRVNTSRTFLQQLSLVTKKSLSDRGENQGIHRMKDGERHQWREGRREHALPTPLESLDPTVLEARKSHSDQGAMTFPFLFTFISVEILSTEKY